jgi:hypothetical protein
MLSAILAGALIAGASLLLGAAIMALADRPRHSPVGPAAGLSALLVICGIAIKLPGHAVTAAVAVGLALVAALWVLGRSRAPMGSVHAGAIVAVIGAALVVAIPFAASGRVGILGPGLVNDDMASHLLFTEWAINHNGPTPDLVSGGYPLGPHAIVAAASAVVPGADLIEGFAGLTGAIAVLAALTAYGALGGVSPRLRAPAAVLAALPDLGAAYLAQGAFKEPMLALGLVGFTLALPSLREAWSGLQPTYVSTLPDRGRGWMRSQARLAIPPGVIAAGTIYNYSFPGLAWLVIAVIAWALIVAWQERDGRDGLELRNRLRWATPLLVAGVAIPVAAALPEVVYLVNFAGFEAFNPEGKGGNVGFGNLRQPLNPLEALGVWPSSEFRIAPKNSSTPEFAFYLGGLLGLAAAAWGVARAIARREAALPAALFSVAFGYLTALAVGTPYTQAKALAVAAPVLMLIVLRGLLSADALEDEPDKEARRWPPRMLPKPLLRWGLVALTVAFAAAAVFSTLLPLRQSAVGPTYHADELRSLRAPLDGQDVLFLGRDNFISWELLGSEVYTPITNPYDTEPIWSLYRATALNAKFDWDNVPPDLPGDRRALADFDWVITTSADFNSQPPPEFEPYRETHDFILWKRTAPGGQRHTLREPIYPGATVNCSNPGIAPLAGLDGVARVLPVAPVVGKAWNPEPDITDAAGATEQLYLRPGTWQVSLQYASTQPLHVAGPGLDTTLRTNLLFRGPSPYYPVGSIDVQPAGSSPAARLRPRPVRFALSVERPPLAGRVLGAESRAYLGRIAATPIGVAGVPNSIDESAPRQAPLIRQRIPLRRACGRYLDWYSVAPGTPPAAVARVEGPTPQAPDEG